MRTIIIALMLVALAIPAAAQTMTPANQVTFAWDAVPPPDCICPEPPCGPTVACSGPNYPSPAAGEMKYQVYLRGDLVSTGTKYGGEITTPELLVSFKTWGRYYLGVEAVFYLAGVAAPIRSTRSWSNVAADADGSPFGVTFLPEILSPGGLRIK